MLCEVTLFWNRRSRLPLMMLAVDSASLGSIPTELGGLTALHTLSLYTNQLSGKSFCAHVPAGEGGMGAVVYLCIGYAWVMSRSLLGSMLQSQSFPQVVSAMTESITCSPLKFPREPRKTTRYSVRSNSSLAFG